jgi:hypothetical protein
MKNIKDITVSIFAIIGFAFLLSSFTTNGAEQQVYGTPESHVWELVIGDGTVYSLHRQTGEVRKYANSPSVSTKGDGWYIKTFEREAKK